MKKSIIALLALAMIVSLAACNNSGGGALVSNGGLSGSYTADDFPGALVFGGDTVSMTINYGEIEEFAELAEMGIDVNGTWDIFGTYTLVGDVVTFFFDEEDFLRQVREMMEALIVDMFEAMGVLDMFDADTISDMIDEQMAEFNMDDMVGTTAVYDGESDTITMSNGTVFGK